MPLRRTTRSSGFSLIEVLIAMAILVIAVIALANLFLLSIQKNAQAGEGTKLTAAALDKMQELLALDYDSPSLTSDFDTVSYDTGFTRQVYDRTWTVDDDTPEDNLKTISVTVTGVETTPGKGFIGKRQEITVSTIMVGDLGGEVRNN